MNPMLFGRRPDSTGRRSLLTGLAVAATAMAACGSSDRGADSRVTRAVNEEDSWSLTSGNAVSRDTSSTGVRYEVMTGSAREILAGDARVKAAGGAGVWCAAIRYGQDRTRVCGGAGRDGDGVMQVLPAGFKGAVVIVASVRRSVAEVKGRLTDGNGTAATGPVSRVGGVHLAHLAIPIGEPSSGGGPPRVPLALEVLALGRAGEVIERQLLHGGPGL